MKLNSPIAKKVFMAGASVALAASLYGCGGMNISAPVDGKTPQAPQSQQVPKPNVLQSLGDSTFGKFVKGKVGVAQKWVGEVGDDIAGSKVGKAVSGGVKSAKDGLVGLKNKMEEINKTAQDVKKLPDTAQDDAKQRAKSAVDAWFGKVLGDKRSK